jgi:hypothetical protein
LLDTSIDFVYNQAQPIHKIEKVGTVELDVKSKAGHRERLKAHFIAGDEGAYTDETLLELLLTYAIPQKDVQPLAKKLLATFGSLSDVLSADITTLCKQEGIKEHSAVLPDARASVKKSSGVRKVSLKRLGTSQDVQIVDHGATAQIKEILTEPTIAGASTLPATNMSQGMLHGDSFAQFGPSLWGLLALAQLDEQGFIGMDADAAALGTGGALDFQGALSTGVFGKVDHAPRLKGHLLPRRTLDGLPLPVQDKCLLVKALPLANGPGFAVDLQLVTTLADQQTAQRGSVDVQLLSHHPLPIQVGADGFRHTGFGDIGWGQAHGSDQTAIEIVKHMALVAIHAHTTTFASVAHLSIFDADASIFGHAFDQARFPFLIDMHILRFHLLSYLHRRLSEFCFALWEGLHPAFYRLQHLQDQA